MLGIMNARNIFGLAVRFCGLLLLMFSFWHLFIGIAYTISSVNRAYDSEDPYHAFLIGIAAFLTGIILLRFARHIVHFSYYKNKDDADA
jgi:hypothetical protein